MKMRKTLLYICLWGLIPLVLIAGLSRVYYRVTDDFRKGNIIVNLDNRDEWRLPPLTESDRMNLNTILSQPFHYLGKGAQSYALESEDGKYILKLFKVKHLRPSKLLNWLPTLPYFQQIRENDVSKKERKLCSVLTGYLTAFSMHRKESGLIYVHINNQHDLNKRVTITDKIGRTWSMDLDPVVFVVQEKSVKLRNFLGNLLQNGNTNGVKHHIRQVISLYLTEYHKGIYDHDHGVMHNFGFVGDRPIHFDVGKLYRDPDISNPHVFKKDLEKITWKISAWLMRDYPQYQADIVQDIEENLSHYLHEAFSVPTVMS